jgi:hypothetical protein
VACKNPFLEAGRDRKRGKPAGRRRGRPWEDSRGLHPGPPAAARPGHHRRARGPGPGRRKVAKHFVTGIGQDHFSYRRNQDSITAEADAIGSACFLISSALAWYEACHGWAAWRPTSYGWWITLANLVGSIAFGISAVAGYINPVTGQVHNATRADTQTLIGAVCFFIGAVLLLPERTEEARGQATAPTGDSTLAS